jgi:hypothetical protein
MTGSAKHRTFAVINSDRDLNLFDFQSLLIFDRVPVSQSRNFTDIDLSGLRRSD